MKEDIKKGFTLIELLVVVLIIGILSAIALPQYQKSVDKARYTQAQILLENILKAEDAYKSENGQYTTRFDELDITIPPPQSHSNNYDYYFYNWGSCWLHETGYIACQIYLNHEGTIAAWYFAMPGSPNRRCWAKPKDNKRANDLCKSLTNKTTGTPNDDYMMYNF